MKDEYYNSYWAGRLIDLPKELAWDIADEIIEVINNAQKEAFEAGKETVPTNLGHGTYSLQKFETFEDYLNQTKGEEST